jgi:Fe2+ or Zn2+ uptake regulation protein
LTFLEDEGVMTLKMVTENIRRTEKISKQTVWNALQLLQAKDLIEKVDRGIYRLNKKKII